MATQTVRRTGKTDKTPEERAGEVEALAEQLTDAVTRLTTSAAWVAMLWVSTQFARYLPTNCLL